MEEARDVNVGELSLEAPSRARSKSWFCFGLSRCHSLTGPGVQVQAGAGKVHRMPGARCRMPGAQVPAGQVPAYASYRQARPDKYCAASDKQPAGGAPQAVPSLPQTQPGAGAGAGASIGH